MSDFNSSLPVRTQTNGDVVAFIADGTTSSQLLGVDSAGRITIKLDDGTGTPINSQAIAGSNWLQVVMPASGPAAPGTASAYSVLAGGIYNSTPPTLTNGQQSSLQLDSAGRLLVDALITFPYDTNYGTVGANTLRTAAQIGNATGGADFNAGATGAQTLRVSANQGAPNTIANAWPFELTDGTHTASITAAGEIKVDITEPLPAGTNVIGGVTQSGGPWTSNLTEVGGAALALGQTTMSASIPVTIASNQSALPVTQSGAWTVAVTQSTSPWITKDQSDGPVSPGTAASFSQLAGGQYNSSAPTLTTGQQSALQLDSAGRLLVDAAVTFPYDENWGTVGATTLRTAAQIGNATGAADFGAGATDAQTLRVVANQGAPNTVANSWFTSITNGTNTASVSAGGELLVTVGTPLPAGTNSIGTVVVSNLPTTVDTNWGTVGANTIRAAAEIGNAAGAADFNNGATGAQTLRVAANLAVAGANVTSTNPVPVTVVSTTAGTAVQAYFTYAALAAGASHTFTYTAGGAGFNLERIWSAASGKIKTQVQNNGTTIFTGFNSTASPNIDMTVVVPPLVAAANTVTVTITNLDLQPFDVYATVEGNQN
jgi:hypothetical protein